MKLSFASLDRRYIYLLILVALLIPLILKVSVRPARMESAERVYQAIDEFVPQKGDVVLISLDFGPNSMAENKPQAEVVIEHLMRRRIPFALYSQYLLAQSFLESIPEEVAKRLMSELPEQKWRYGDDWVNLGVKLGSSQVNIQALAESKNIPEYLKKDARGNSLSELRAFKDVRSLNNIPLFVQFTSLTGTFEAFVQFLKSESYRPRFLHGCTSITIPKAYIYLDSGQLSGLLEGVAGAAWYSQMLSQKFPLRVKDDSILINTGLGVAHLVIVGLIVLGNLVGLLKPRRNS